MYLAQTINYSKKKELTSTRPENIDLMETFSLVQELQKITSEINETRENKNWDLIFNFHRSYKWGEYTINLVETCNSGKQFGNFISSMYFMAYEATEGKVFNHKFNKIFYSYAISVHRTTASCSKEENVSS